MPLFEFEAKTMQGITIKGKQEAVDKKAVMDNLRAKNYYPLSIKPYKDILNIDLTKYKKLSIRDIAIFCRQFSFINSSGINILRAIKIVKEQSESKRFKKILEEVFNDLQRGKNFSEALNKHSDIPQMLINMIEVGEVSGTLDKIMERMADYYDKEYKFSKKVSQAMTYPMVVSVFALVVVFILVVKVLPTFIGILSSLGIKELPLPTKIVMAISYAIIHRSLIIIGFLIVSILIIRVLLRNEKTAFIIDSLKLKLPIFGRLNKKIITARFSRTFGTLIRSGVPIVQSIDICANVVGNKLIGEVLKETREEMKKGTSVGENLEMRGVFPIMLTQMIKIGEESGTLDSVLEKTAEFYDNEVDSTTAQLTALIEPLIIILLSIVVGFIILAIILPIFQMYNTLGT